MTPTGLDDCAPAAAPGAKCVTVNGSGGLIDFQPVQFWPTQDSGSGWGSPAYFNGQAQAAAAQAAALASLAVRQFKTETRGQKERFPAPHTYYGQHHYRERSGRGNLGTGAKFSRPTLTTVAYKPLVPCPPDKVPTAFVKQAFHDSSASSIEKELWRSRD